jgi:phosphatidylserine/phosphatidylglycerophosphate/cardiolipin synthase-like enzyme
MPKFLTTAGLNNAIEQLVNSTKNNIILVTPYVNIHKRLKEILIQKK